MHPSSMEHMSAFRATLPASGRVLDVGSMDVNGSYRSLFDGWEYFGLDAAPGRGVDYAPADPYAWTDLESASFDVVISGQALEHVEFPERTMAEIARVLRPGGLACIIAPSAGGRHHAPWYRNVSADYMRELANGAGLEVVSLGIGDNEPWRDCVLIARRDNG